eukprot:352579-Chlamydomonas_euryale.AAC.4
MREPITRSAASAESPRGVAVATAARSAAADVDASAMEVCSAPVCGDGDLEPVAAAAAAAVVQSRGCASPRSWRGLLRRVGGRGSPKVQQRQQQQGQQPPTQQPPTQQQQGQQQQQQQQLRQQHAQGQQQHAQVQAQQQQAQQRQTRQGQQREQQQEARQQHEDQPQQQLQGHGQQLGGPRPDPPLAARRGGEETAQPPKRGDGSACAVQGDTQHGCPDSDDHVRGAVGCARLGAGVLADSCLRHCPAHTSAPLHRAALHVSHPVCVCGGGDRRTPAGETQTEVETRPQAEEEVSGVWKGCISIHPATWKAGHPLRKPRTWCATIAGGGAGSHAPAQTRHAWGRSRCGPEGGPRRAP